MSIHQRNDTLLFFSGSDYHKEFAGIITAMDFSTYYPNPHRDIPYTQMERKVKQEYNQKLCERKDTISHE